MRNLLVLFTCLVLGSGLSHAQVLPGYRDPFLLFDETEFRESMATGEFNGTGLQHLKMMQLRLRNAERKNNQRIAGLVAGKIGALLATSGESDSALFYFRRSARAFAAAGMPRAEGAAQTATGILLEQKKEYDPALKALNAALDKFSSIGFQDGLIAAHSWKARIFDEQHNDRKALEELLLAYKFASASSADVRAKMANRIGEEYIHLERDKESLQYFNTALSLYGQLGDRKGKATVFRNLGIVHYKSGQYQEALAFFQQSIREDENLSTMRLLRDTYLKLFAASRISRENDRAEAYNKSYKVYKDSVEYLLNSRELSPDSFARELEEKVYIADLLNRNGQLNGNTGVSSVEYNQRLTETELERLKTEEALARMNQQRVDDQVASKERQDRIQELEREKAIQDLALTSQKLKEERQRRLIFLLGTGVILVLLITGFVYWRYRNKKKSHATLDLAYADLSRTHQQLEAAQDQLVHAAKMASLGQMTAGIAHEIQNPLNFVNNFAESSAELLLEFSEAGTDEERKNILADLQLNLSKIIQHGKRADSIVKNMLQHSRTRSNEKEPVDLNKLTGEYMQMAYHGLRAKHPEFICKLETSFDPELPLVPLVVQDFSRVLLNLINNALYAVHEKYIALEKEGIAFSPTLHISTIKLSRYVTLVVRDNGTGIDSSLKEKIFQPFFTTKPTGEGTGLGLSLSFDIVKAHGGELRMSNAPDEGAVFTVLLPLQQS